MWKKSLPITLIAISVALTGCNSAVEDLDDNSTSDKLQQRIQQQPLALYTFTVGAGDTVYDISEVQPPLDLIIEDLNAIEWLEKGIRINSETLIRSSVSADKINDAVRSSNAVTIEAWVTPANTTQSGPSRIVSISESPLTRNITLGQSSDMYMVRLNTTDNETNGTPPLTTSNATLTTELTHITFTWNSATHEATIYVNGHVRASSSTIFTGDLSLWRDFELILATEIANDTPDSRYWLGEMYLVAIYDRALTTEEIQINYDLGF